MLEGWTCTKVDFPVRLAKSCWLFARDASRDDPGGYTVCKSKKLPDGDFWLDEQIWPGMSLWFVRSDKFTSGERERARRLFGKWMQRLNPTEQP